MCHQFQQLIPLMPTKNCISRMQSKQTYSNFKVTENAAMMEAVQQMLRHFQMPPTTGKGTSIVFDSVSGIVGKTTSCRTNHCC